MYHPILVLEACRPETNWNDNTMLAICCDYLHILMLRQPSIYKDFESYVMDRMNEERTDP